MAIISSPIVFTYIAQRPVDSLVKNVRSGFYRFNARLVLNLPTIKFIFSPNYIYHLINTKAVDISNNDASGDFRAHNGYVNTVKKYLQR